MINNKSVLIIGQEKGRFKQQIERNFGMMRPEGYRKCIRLMKLADRFQIPVISFIDTPEHTLVWALNNEDKLQL